ncbi:MAG: helix-turn-helix domain-containing protein [Candidatus Heimdallarchaeota archaeon]
MKSEVIPSGLEEMRTVFEGATGLSEKESSVLFLLIKYQDGLSGNEVARMTRMTRYYAYEILRKLQDRGFVETTAGRPKKYLFDPLAFKRLLSDTAEETEHRIMLLEKQDWEALCSEAGITDIQIAVYKTIENEGEATTKHIQARLPNYSHRQILGALSTLHRKQWIDHRKISREHLYFLFPQDQVFTREKILLEQRVESKIAEISQLVRVLDENPQEHSQNRQNGEIVLLKGSQVLSKVASLIESGSDICLMRTAQLSSGQLSENAKLKIIRRIVKSVRKVATRGGQVRLILGEIFVPALFSSLENDDLVNIFKIYPACQVRITGRDLPCFDLIDRSVILDYISISRPPLCLKIIAEEAVSAKRNLFDHVWDDAQDFRLWVTHHKKMPDTIRRIVGRTLQAFPPHIPSLNLRESGVHVFESPESVIGAVQVILEGTQREVLFASLETVPVGGIARTALQQAFQALLGSIEKGVKWKILWKSDSEVSSSDIELVLSELHQFKNAEVGFYEGELDLGTFFILDDEILIALSLSTWQGSPNGIIVTQDPFITSLASNHFNQFWLQSSYLGS